MHDLGKGIEVSGTVTIGQIIATGAVEEATAAVAALSASYYLGALLGAAIYASAKQGWDFLTGAPVSSSCTSATATRSQTSHCLPRQKKCFCQTSR